MVWRNRCEMTATLAGRKTANRGPLTKAIPVSRQLGNPLHQQVFLVLRDRILSRRYDVGAHSGARVRTGFQVWADLLADHTPERMSEVSTVPAETIRRIARKRSSRSSDTSSITSDSTA